jgi:drug/metabolite transporter (DMT)-like permease
MPFYGELIALLTTLSWSLCVFPFAEAARRLNPNATNILRLLLAVLLLSFATLLIADISPIALFTGPSTQHWLWLGLSGLIGLSLGDYLSFTTYTILGTRTGTIFTTLAPGVALSLGYIMLHETINSIGIIGIGVTVVGVISVILSKKAPIVHYADYGSKRMGITLGILAAVCQGVGLVFAKKAFTNLPVGDAINPVHATWVRMVVALLSVLLLNIMMGKLRPAIAVIKQNENKGVQFTLLGTLFGPVIGVSLSLYTIGLIPVSVAQTIFSLVPVLVLPLSYLFYREKITYRAVIGMCVALTGVFLLIWRNELQQHISTLFS